MPNPAPDPVRRRVGIRDVAARAGVGVATVSRVLAGRTEVRAELRERVLAAAAELGYEPDMLAQSLRRGQTRTVGFIADDLAIHLISDIAAGAEGALRAEGYSLLVMNSEMDTGLEALNIRVLRARRVDALMLAPVSEDDPEVVAMLSGLDIPLVVIESDMPKGVPAGFVVSDHRAGVAAALRHLVELGHRRICLLTGPEGLRSARQRHLGLEDVASEVDGTAELFHRAVPLSGERGRDVTASLLADRATAPTAIVVGSDDMLVGVLEAIEAAGRTVGRDVALVTCDPVPLASVYHPPLAAITRDSFGIGRRAAGMLLRRLADPPVARRDGGPAHPLRAPGQRGAARRSSRLGRADRPARARPMEAASGRGRTGASGSPRVGRSVVTFAEPTRESRLDDSRAKIHPPFRLDDSMRFYSPQENLAAFDHPRVRAWLTWIEERWQPPETGRARIALLMPCTKQKPYAISREHRAINGALQSSGWQPIGDARAVPEQLVAELDPGATRPPRRELPPPRRRRAGSHRRIGAAGPRALHGDLHLAGRPEPGHLVRRPRALRVARHVGLSMARPAAPRRGGRTDGGHGDPPSGTPTSMRTTACERVIGRTLARVRDRYRSIVAWVSPGLTHRSFLLDRERRQAEGLALARSGIGGRRPLRGVLDDDPGLVTVLPTVAQLDDARARLRDRLAREGRPASPGAVRAIYARGDGTDTPLGLPEALDHLLAHLDALTGRRA